ncbi:60S ribosomal export protein NMD3-like [Anneissia japonica]|uniref:60S ribosomal export protein NMD3-like n=1 Tax=Anneissia japonica TaxID=1529436 RepID=UPI0014257D39|nr:60S ribosomal export protein NMD3-like [Anneissia japonica]
MMEYLQGEVTRTEGTILCCLCETPIAPNPANMCVACMRTQVDITEGIPKQATIYFCKSCERYLQPPSHWVSCTLESRELLALCLKKLKGLQKVTLIDASFVWTEPHSKRIKVKLTIQKEVLGGAVLQQVFIVEFTVNYQMCDDCHRVEAKDFWKAVVQIRQKATHKKTFFYVEQLMLKHRSHSKALNIKQHDGGLDFYFATKDDARKLVEFLASVIPCRNKTSQRLISHDIHNNTYNYKYTFSVEISPVCKNDIVCLSKKFAASVGNLGQLCICTKVTNSISLINPATLQTADVPSNVYWRNAFTSLCTLKQLTEFIVLQTERVEDRDRRHVAGQGSVSNKHLLADVWVQRSQDLGISDVQIHCRTHLGHLLNVGDSVLGFDCNHANINDPNFSTLNPEFVPDVILVKKHYGNRQKRNRRRAWKLKTLNKELNNMETDSTNTDYNQFLEDLEEDVEYRKNVNIYLDRSKVNVAVESSDEGEMPQVSLQEMLDDLHLTDEGMEEAAAGALE